VFIVIKSIAFRQVNQAEFTSISIIILRARAKCSVSWVLGSPYLDFQEQFHWLL